MLNPSELAVCDWKNASSARPTDRRVFLQFEGSKLLPPAVGAIRYGQTATGILILECRPYRPTGSWVLGDSLEPIMRRRIVGKDLC